MMDHVLALTFSPLVPQGYETFLSCLVLCFFLVAFSFSSSLPSLSTISFSFRLFLTGHLFVYAEVGLTLDNHTVRAFTELCAYASLLVHDHVGCGRECRSASVTSDLLSSFLVLCFHRMCDFSPPLVLHSCPHWSHSVSSRLSFLWSRFMFPCFAIPSSHSCMYLILLLTSQLHFFLSTANASTVSGSYPASLISFLQ